MTTGPVVTPGAHPPAGLPGHRRARWATERSLWSPRTIAIGESAALMASRPHCAYRTVVDLALFEAEPGVTARALLAGVLQDAADSRGDSPAAVAVHVQEFPADPFAEETVAALRSIGFVLQPQPVPSAASTRLGDETGVRVWSWWRSAAPARAIPYYGQTTEVTCGAVSALGAVVHRGVPTPFTGDLPSNRAAELAFWRKATNMPACEPIGLAVEMGQVLRASDRAAALPEVFLSTDALVLLEEFADNEFELTLRTDLQRESLRQAQVLGLTIHRRWLDTAEIVGALRRGALVLLLIDLTDLIDDPTAHWVLAYDVVDDHVIVSDPWIQYPAGETWADTYALPLPRRTVDLIGRWGEPPYRGAIII